MQSHDSPDRQHLKDLPGYVYLIEKFGKQYVGMTRNPKVRLRSHRREDPKARPLAPLLKCINYIHAEDVERILHRIQKSCDDVRPYFCVELLKLHKLFYPLPKKNVNSHL